MTIDLDKINVTPKQIGIGVGVVLALTVLIGIATVEEEPQVLPPPITTKQLNSNTINVANDFVIANLKDGVLNKGYTLKSKIYYMRSQLQPDFYIFGAIVEHNGILYDCIWANTDVNTNGMFDSVNKNANRASNIMISDKFSYMDIAVASISTQLKSELNKLNVKEENSHVNFKKNIIEPNTACNYLLNKGLISSEYKKYDYGDNYIEYFCIEDPLYMVGEYSAIHYSVEGNANLANKIVLQLVYNNVFDSEPLVKDKYLNLAQALYYKIFNETMPENMNSAILNNANSTFKKNNISVSSKYEKYENGRGYRFNLEFLIEN